MTTSATPSSALSSRSLWRVIFPAICAILSALLCMIYFVAPPVADDLWFSVPDAEGMPLGERLSAAMSLTASHWTTDTLRLCNQPVALLLALPSWVTELLIFICCIVALEGGRRLAEAPLRSVTAFAWIGAFFILLPWYDYLISTSYALNYLLSTAIVIPTAIIFIRSTHRGGGGVGVGSLALAFLAGWCHEGFSAPMLCGMIVMIAAVWLKERRYTALSLCMAVITALGIGVIFLSPMFQTRAGTGGWKLGNLPLWEAAIQIGPSLMILLVTVAASIPALCKKFLRPRLLMLLTMAVAAETVAVVFYSGPRTAWASTLYSLIALASLPGEYGLRRSRPALSLTAATLVLAGVGASLVAAVSAQKRLTAEMKEVIALYRQSPDGQVFYDITTPSLDMTLMKTTVRALNEYVPLQFISIYESQPSDTLKELRILPAALRDFRAADDSTARDLTVYNGYVISTDSCYYPGHARSGSQTPPAEIILNGSIHTRYTPFAFTAADGSKACWLKTHAQSLNPGLSVSTASEVVP